MPVTFSWEQLQAAIKACGNVVVGCGGFGTVYRGCLKGLPVAIKVSSDDSYQDRQDFDWQVAISTGSLQHPNLLQLLGTCPERRALVYLFMEGGSLDQRINRQAAHANRKVTAAACELLPGVAAGTDVDTEAVGPAFFSYAGRAESDFGDGECKPLTWQDRVRITHEVALALLWLHTCAPSPGIPHLNLNSSNVLLDRFLTAKVSNVGLPRRQSCFYAPTAARPSGTIASTIAYMAPEYGGADRLFGPFTDVYSLGVIMCELLTGKLAQEALQAMEEPFKMFTTAAAEQAAHTHLQPVLDLAAGWPLATAVKYAALAAACLTSDHTARPCVQLKLQPALEDLAAAAALSVQAVQPQQQPTLLDYDILGKAVLTVATDQPNNRHAWTALSQHYQKTEQVDLSDGPGDNSSPVFSQKLDGRSSLAFLMFVGAAAANWHNMRVLNLSGHCIGGDGVRSLALHAMYWTDLQQLNLSWNKVGAGGAQALSWYAAKHWSQLQQLHLSCDGIEAGGVAALAQHAAQHWSQLQQLDLSWNNMGANGAAVLARCAAKHWSQLQQLNLSGNMIGASGAEAIAELAAEHWPQLRQLDLRHNQLGTGGAEALAWYAAKHWSQLQQLHLNNNNLGAVGTEQLAKCAAHRWLQLRQLDLSRNSIGDSGAKELAEHAAQEWSQLQQLNLSGNMIGARGIEALAQRAARHWSQLQQLDLSWNDIGDDGAAALALYAAKHWSQLQQLDLHFSKIGASGCKALATNAAEHWSQLQQLDLSENRIGAGGAQALACSAAQHWSQLRQLKLSFGCIGDGGAVALAQNAAQHWSQLQQLKLNSNDIGASGTEALAQQAAEHCLQLQQLDLRANRVAAAGAAALARHWPQVPERYLIDDQFK